NKAIAFVPPEGSRIMCNQTDVSAHLIAIGRKDFFPCYDMSDVVKAVDVLRVRKILKSLHIFFPLKDSMLSFGAQSSYISLDHIRQRFGCRFTHMNAEQIFNAIDELTEEEKQECEQMAKEIVSSAEETHMPLENTIKDCIFFGALKKLMAQRDCNAFTIPCFEVCATRELNKRQFTFCLGKSLLREEGIPSACAGDVGAILTNALLMAVCNASPHMGNTMVWERANNICRLQHDSPTRYMKGYDKPMMPYHIVNFAKDGWGSTIRYDFCKDKGQKITLANMSPDFTKIVICEAEIEGCEDFLTPECVLACRFRVKDAEQFLNCQKYVGHHFGLVYGSWSQQIKDVAESLGMEVLYC
ncbi:MAG: hypothetical protein HUK24_08685, partial [Sphaerochaetaceae bacterium]|nr:hypothetical protein [Sphaerochaetaceae bacterium]